MTNDNHLFYNQHISISYYILTAMFSRRCVHQKGSQTLLRAVYTPQNKRPDIQGQNGWVGGRCRFHVSSITPDPHPTNPRNTPNPAAPGCIRFEPRVGKSTGLCGAPQKKVPLFKMYSVKSFIHKKPLKFI